jgi:hypothetical protein
VNSTRDPVFGCELADGRKDRDGYVFHGQSRAHIVAWERVHGQRPEGMEVEHTCRRRACCRVVHLELVTRSENEKRKSWRYRAKRTHCKNGHDMKINAMITPEGGRVCRSCSRSDLP